VPADTQLVYDSQYGLGWEDQLGWEVYFGLQTSDMEQRLVVYQGVVDYLTDHGLQPELVSVEFIHAPYYRMER
jgi:cell division protein FtsQ